MAEIMKQKCVQWDNKTNTCSLFDCTLACENGLGEFRNCYYPDEPKQETLKVF